MNNPANIRRKTYLDRCIAYVDAPVIKIITGSNSNLLSGELATFLTGRFVEFHLYPLSFWEFLEFRNSADAKGEFANYTQ